MKSKPTATSAEDVDLCIHSIVKSSPNELKNFLEKKYDCDEAGKLGITVRLGAPKNLQNDYWKDVQTIPMKEECYRRNWITPVNAILNSDQEALTKHLKSQPPIVDNLDSWSLAHYAVRVENLEALPLLKKYNYSLSIGENTRVKEFGCFHPGMTPLLLACKLGNLNTIQYLLNLGVSPEEKDIYGRGVFIYSMLSGNLEAAEFWAQKGIGKLEQGEKKEDIWEFSRNLGGEELVQWVNGFFGNGPSTQSAKETTPAMIFTFEGLSLPQEFIEHFNRDFKTYLNTPKKSKGIALFGERGTGKSEIANYLQSMTNKGYSTLKTGALERSALIERMSKLDRHSIIIFDDSDLIFENSTRSLVMDHERKDWINLLERLAREVGHYWVFLGSFEGTLTPGENRLTPSKLQDLFGSVGEVVNGVDGHIPSWNSSRLLQAFGKNANHYTDEALVLLIKNITSKKLGLRGLLVGHNHLITTMHGKNIIEQDVEQYTKKYL